MNDEPSEPAIEAASRAGWLSWLARLMRAGQARLTRLGLALVLGFTTAVVAIYGFATVADEVMEREGQRVDDAVLTWLRAFSSPTGDWVARLFSALGSELVLLLLVVLLAVFAKQRRWGAAVALLVTTAGSQVLNSVLKETFHRTRPAPVLGLTPAQSFSFSSGHAMVSAAFYFFLAYLGWRLFGGWLRWAWAGTLLTLVLLIGLARLYLGVHYVTDIIAGYLAGFVWADAVIIGGYVLGQRHRRQA